jgi:hypothetical protein
MAQFKKDFLATRTFSIGKIIPDGEITIREPSRLQVYEIKRAGGDDEKTVDAVMKIAPEIVIDHNVEDEDGKMSIPTLLKALFNSMNFTTLFAEEVTAFFPSKKKKSEE